MQIREHVPYLRVADMARSLAFYTEGLGFMIARSMEDSGDRFWARIEKDGMALMLSDRPSRFVEDPDDEHEHDATGDHEHVFHGVESVHAGALNLVFYVYVDDVDAVHAELTSRGVAIVEPPGDRFFGLREFLVRDPDGYYFAFAHTISDA